MGSRREGGARGTVRLDFLRRGPTGRIETPSRTRRRESLEAAFFTEIKGFPRW
jgi:hypothetical protein